MCLQLIIVSRCITYISLHYFHGRLSTGGLVSLKDRRNGGVLFVALTCPEGQVAQCRGDHFGSLDQTVAALTPLANDYARGVLTRVELKKELERIKKEKEKEVVITTKEEKKIVKQEKAEKDKTGKQPPDSSAAMPIKKEVNKKRTRDDEDTQLFDDEDTLPWGLDEDVEMMFTSTRTATDVSEREWWLGGGRGGRDDHLCLIFVGVLVMTSSIRAWWWPWDGACAAAAENVSDGTVMTMCLVWWWPLPGGCAYGYDHEVGMVMIMGVAL